MIVSVVFFRNDSPSSLHFGGYRGQGYLVANIRVKTKTVSAIRRRGWACDQKYGGTVLAQGPGATGMKAM